MFINKLKRNSFYSSSYIGRCFNFNFVRDAEYVVLYCDRNGKCGNKRKYNKNHLVSCQTIWPRRL